MKILKIEGVTWTYNDDDDLLAVVGDYMLRVEQMDEGKWWWEVYFGEETLSDYVDCMMPTKETALYACLVAYRLHQNIS